MNFIKKSFIACFMCLVMVVGFSYSQAVSGKIIGVVTDEEGVPLPGVSVEIQSLSLMGTRAFVTLRKGQYRFINLPPGEYKVLFTLDGFGGVERQNIKVRIGGTTTVDVRLKAAAIEEEITVIAKAPVIDVEKTGVSSTFDSSDLTKLPTGRSGIASQLDFVPGFQAESSFGSDGTDNNYTLNGLQISSPESGEFRMDPGIDMVEDVEVMTSGAPAEYGQATGAVVNVVTKSGQNDFEGTVSLYMIPSFLVGDNNPKEEYGADWQSYKRNRWHDVSFMLSGSVARDKVWYFLYLKNQMYSTVRFRGDPDYPRKGIGWNGEFKLTGQIGTRHKVSGNFFYIYSGNPMQEPGELVAEEATAHHYFSKPSHFGFWDWQASSNALLSVKMGFWCNPEREGDPVPEYGSSLYRAPHLDLITDINTNATAFFLMWNNARFQVNTTVSYYAENFLGSAHDFKMGVQYDKGESHPAGGYPGNAFYYDLNRQPYRVYQRNPNHYGGQVEGLGIFVDDTLKIGDRLTINAGVRYDWNKGSVPAWPLMDGPDDIPGSSAPDLPNAINWKVISPRIGFTLELTPDHKTLLKGFWGLFHAMPHGTKFGCPGPGRRDTLKYEYIGPAIPEDQLPYYTLVEGPPWNVYSTNPKIDPDNWVLYDQILGEAAFYMDPEMKNPASSQFSLGLEREIVTDFAVGLNFIYKKEWDLLGLEDQGPEYELVQITSPDSETAGYPADKLYPAYNLVGGSHYIVQMNPEDYYLKYKSIVLTINKKYSNNWMFFGSIQWQDGKGLNMAMDGGGNNQEFWQNNFGLDPNDLTYRDGPLPFVVPWIAKARFAYTFPYGINFGLNYTFAVGQLYPRKIRLADLNQGMRYIWAEPLGDYKQDDVHTLDIRVEKIFNFEHFKFHLMADVFNVLNNDKASGTSQERWWSSEWVGSPKFMEPRRICSPLEVQLGIKLAF